MKKVALLFLILVFILGANTVSLAESQDVDAVAQGFLDALDNCPPVSTDENLIGFSIDKIEKDGDDFIVYWSATNEIISGNSSNVAYAFSLIKFYDPEDYTNAYQGYTVQDGEMHVDFSAGESISYDHVRVRFSTPSNVVYLYFAGAPDGPEQIFTVPLFYTLILNDEPRVLEETPRAANDLFAE
ncbi:MAG: hypothetical protein LLF96_09270 [Eubacteriales bacterium]|nr:hypothetical protein [Eubacteriales bacterium]